MDKEISDAEFEKTAVERLKSRHHHTDGSEVVLSPVEESDMERRIIEEENAWKQKTQQTATPDIGNSSDKQRPPKKTEEPEPVEVKNEKKTVVASCNCGQIFFSTFSNRGNPAESVIRVKAYDASGNVSKTYSESGAQQKDYAVSGSMNADYAKR